MFKQYYVPNVMLTKIDVKNRQFTYKSAFCWLIFVDDAHFYFLNLQEPILYFEIYGGIKLK